MEHEQLPRCHLRLERVHDLRKYRQLGAKQVVHLLELSEVLLLEAVGHGSVVEQIANAHCLMRTQKFRRELLLG